MEDSKNNLIWLIQKLGYKAGELDPDFDPIYESYLGISNFEKRLKLQKIVYLLEKKFGYDLFGGYEYDIYLNGPYSTGLMSDYVRLTDDDLEKKVRLKYKDAKAVSEMVKKLKKLSPFDLELMTTILSMLEQNSLEDAINLTYNLKSKKLEEEGKNIDYIKNNIIKELKKLRFLDGKNETGQNI